MEISKPSSFFSSVRGIIVLFDSKVERLQVAVER